MPKHAPWGAESTIQAPRQSQGPRSVCTGHGACSPGPASANQWGWGQRRAIRVVWGDSAGLRFRASPSQTHPAAWCRFQLRLLSTVSLSCLCHQCCRAASPAPARPAWTSLDTHSPVPALHSPHPTRAEPCTLVVTFMSHGPPGEPGWWQGHVWVIRDPCLGPLISRLSAVSCFPTLDGELGLFLWSLQEFMVTAWRGVGEEMGPE